MERERAELSSLESMVQEVLARVTETAEGLDGRGHEHAAADLYEVERALQLAARRLEAVVRSMR